MNADTLGDIDDLADRPDLTTKLTRADRRVMAWARVVAAVNEMRSGLDHRIWLEDPDDLNLESDCRNFSELALALTDFLRARRS